MLYFTNGDNDDAVIPSSRSSQRKTNEHVFNQNNAFIKKNHLTIATIATRFLL